MTALLSIRTPVYARTARTGFLVPIFLAMLAGMLAAWRQLSDLPLPHTHVTIRVLGLHLSYTAVKARVMSVIRKVCLRQHPHFASKACDSCRSSVSTCLYPNCLAQACAGDRTCTLQHERCMRTAFTRSECVPADARTRVRVRVTPQSVVGLSILVHGSDHKHTLHLGDTQLPLFDMLCTCGVTPSSTHVPCVLVRVWLQEIRLRSSPVTLL